MPVPGTQRKALAPLGPEEYPATWPFLLMPNAWPHLSPGSKAIHCKPPSCYRMNGTMALWMFEAPATCPASLMANAELYSPPGKAPKCCAFKVPWFQIVARVCPPTGPLPARSPRLLSRRGTWPAFTSSEIIYSGVWLNTTRIEVNAVAVLIATPSIEVYVDRLAVESAYLVVLVCLLGLVLVSLSGLAWLLELGSGSLS